MSTSMQEARKQKFLRDALASISRLDRLFEKLDEQIKASRVKKSA